ncbi:peroxynitrite isomerase THAP4-like [Anoplopoma fimbria]|uniref:peroxynitrite isomerase THAP4-like n=1 Tax=Anoplopoma fimbria TaxID=229290 RepID=UPI0023EDE4E6|nr:peroxynitrite isomerase THAP4-like [Anoplopoma fimbria]
MPDSCCAVGCTNRRGNKPGLCFYRIPSEREHPERRALWICAIKRGKGKQWQPSKYTRICSEHFVKGAKSDIPISPDWVPSVFTPATKKRKREKQHSGMKNKRVEEEEEDEEKKKKQAAVDVLLELSSVPRAKEEQQCTNRPCREKIERLKRECNGLWEENQRLKYIIRSGNFDDLALVKETFGK